MTDKEPTMAESIEAFAKLQFTDEELALIVDLPLEKLRSDYSENIDRGRLLAEAEIRQAMMRLAKEGNATAMKRVQELHQAAKTLARKNR